MAVALLLAGAAERHFLQDRDVIVDHRGLARHEARAVIQQDALADARRRVNLDREDLRNAVLYRPGERGPPLPPQPVADAVALQRLEPFEEEQRNRVARRRRVALAHGLEVGRRRGGDLGVGGEGLADDFGDGIPAEHGSRELARQHRLQRLLEARGAQERLFEKRRECRLRRRHDFGFPAHPLPQHVNWRECVAGGAVELGLRHASRAGSSALP